MGQYDHLIGAEDFAAAYNGKKLAEKTRLPRYPKEVVGDSKCILHRVVRIKTKNAGTMFEFTFTVVETDAPQLRPGKKYTLSYFPGVGEIKQAICWSKMTPFLRAVHGYTGPVADYDAVDGLGELLSICQEDAGIDLEMPFRMSSEMVPARPGKDGIIKHLDENGNPKLFRNDDFDVLADEEVASSASSSEE